MEIGDIIHDDTKIPTSLSIWIDVQGICFFLDYDLRWNLKSSADSFFLGVSIIDLEICLDSETRQSVA